jgi:nucleotidyltransferase/DNA polymerase involved in DNA repair
MSLRKARRLCPQLKVLQGHAAIYRCFSESLSKICRRYAPAIETYLDEAFGDFSGTELLYGGDLLAVGREIKARILAETGLKTTVGIGRNRMFAKMAGRSVKPDGLRRIEAEAEDPFLRGLPVRELPGVGPRVEKVLARLNVRTIDELRRLPRYSLLHIFGRPGEALFERCRGRDSRVISPREIPRSISRETSFHEDTTDSETIEGTLHYLTERATNTLRGLGLKACQIEVKIRYRDAETCASRRKLRTPTQLDSELFALAVQLRRTIHTRRAGLRGVGITLSNLLSDSGYCQLELFDDLPNGSRQDRGSRDLEPPTPPSIEQRRKERSLLSRLDTIRHRYGHASVVCGRSIQLLGRLEQDEHGFVLRTPCLTR